MEKKLLAGYARTDITPKGSVPLAGYGNTLQRMSQGVLDPLKATCLAFTDPQDNTMLLFSLDLIGAHDAYTLPVRNAISEKWGIPVEGIVLAATHTHSGPDMDQKEHPAVISYLKALVEKLTELADAALSDRREATVEWGRTHNEGMNYVRHYVLENGDICGDNFGNPNVSPYKDHVSGADREIRLVKFCRDEGGDILLVNWQAHPTMASTSATEHGRAGRPYISADYVGACRRYVEENTGMHFVYFQGAAGNINSRSRMESEVDTRDHKVYGKQLGDYIIEGAKDLQPLSGTKVDYAAATVSGKLNHTEDHLVPYAQRIREEWIKTNDYRHCADMAVPYGIHSPYHAGSILVRKNLGEAMDFSLSAGRIGSIGLAFLPYEMFDTNGLQVRKASEFDMTLVISCANGRYNYFPSRSAFEHGCYEADMCKFAPGIAEVAADTAVELLNKLHRA